MSFVKKELTKEKAQELIDKYHIASPWPSDVSDTLRGLMKSVHSKDALFGVILIPFGSVINGNGMVHDPDGLDGVGVLIWQDNVIRIDYYEDLMEARREVLVVATKIIAPDKLKGRDEEIIKLLGDAIIAYLTFDLPPANQNDKYTFKPTDITFTDREDIWNL